jgi:hypothetical protein
VTIVAAVSTIGTPPGTLTFTDSFNSQVYSGILAGTANGATYYYITVNTGGAPLAVGKHIFTAHYSGDTLFDPADASITLTIT